MQDRVLHNANTQSSREFIKANCGTCCGWLPDFIQSYANGQSHDLEVGPYLRGSWLPEDGITLVSDTGK